MNFPHPGWLGSRGTVTSLDSNYSEGGARCHLRDAPYLETELPHRMDLPELRKDYGSIASC